MEPNRSGSYIVGVDVGGTNTRCAVVDKSGNRKGEGRGQTPAMAPPDVVAKAISDIISEAIADASVSKLEVAGVGIGMPGRITSEGVILWSPNFDRSIEGFRLVDAISGNCGLPVWMENDVNVAALGEFRFGAGRGAHSMVMFTLGTGIGGGIVLNGEVWSGFNAGGAELGHMVVNPGGRKCGCGNHGCLEAMAQRDAIIDRAVQKFQSGRVSSLADRVDHQADRVTPALIAEYAEAGDPVCVETMAETGFWIGVGAANMINILNPEVVIIGGGISQAGPALWDPMIRTVNGYAIHESRVACRILPAELGDDAGIMGGVGLVLKALGEA